MPTITNYSPLLIHSKKCFHHPSGVIHFHGIMQHIFECQSACDPFFWTYITIPMGSAQAECFLIYLCFIRPLKTSHYLCLTMSKELFSQLSLLFIETEVTKNIDLGKVADKFADENEMQNVVILFLTLGQICRLEINAPDFG